MGTKGVVLRGAEYLWILSTSGSDSNLLMTFHRILGISNNVTTAVICNLKETGKPLFDFQGLGEGGGVHFLLTENSHFSFPLSKNVSLSH